jgi:nitrile hydratase accessory protein
LNPELDPDGPAAPPRRNGELAFDEPWQGRLFATSMALCEAAVIAWPDLRERLIEEVARRDADELGPETYWAAWQDALESLLADAGVCDRAELARRAEEFAQHP